MDYNSMEDDAPRIHWLVALVPFAVLVVLQVLVIKQFGSDAIDGASQTALLFSAAVAVAIVMVGYKVPWKDINSAIGENIKTIGPAILILFLIGAISGSWMMSGVVPTMIYYGMKVITPSLFLFMACFICALVSLITGSSWTTVATVGIALVGIGTAHGYSVGWTAGAIISGAYFGDQYLSIVLTGNIYKQLYKEMGFEGRLLSRSTEDSATVTSVLVPWNTCGMTQSMVLKVPTLEYLPYCFFNLISPLMSITVAVIGYKIFRRTEEEKTDLS